MIEMDRHYADVVAGARAASAELVLVEREGEHALVTLNEPDRLNALSAALTVRLHDALRELAADESLRAIVLTGADPAFSAGGATRRGRWSPVRAAPPSCGAGSACSSAASRG
jgi:2-(1,2-epoxy-1,2-dihydrophenyl)acetyl-CoA isomerase